MVPWNPASVAFSLGAVDQGKGARHLLAGELTEAINLRMVKEDEWRKRPGFDRTTCNTFSGSSHSGTPKEYAIVSGADMWRDGTDQVWARDPDGNIAYFRGKQQRVFPEHFAVPKPATGFTGVNTSLRKPLVVFVGNDVWVFSANVDPADPYAGYSVGTLSVFEATTRVLRYSGTLGIGGSGIGIAGMCNWAAAYDSANSKVWLLTVGMGDTIACASFAASSPSAIPTDTTYRTVASKAFNTIDIKKLSNGEFLVTASSFVAGSPHDCYFEHSYLTTSGGSAGTAKGSPAPVATTSTPADTTPRCCTGIRILNYDGASGTAYYALWRTKTTNVVQLVLVAVNTTTLAISAGPTELDTFGTTQVANPVIGACSGYRAANGDRVVYAQVDSNETTKPRFYTVTRYTYNGSSTTELVVARNAVLLSDPFLQGSTYYFLTGYDDGQTTKAQRTYFLRDQDGRLVSQILPGEAGPAWHQAVGRDSGGGLYLHHTSFVNLPVNHTSNRWLAGVVGEDSANESSRVLLIDLDFGETYAPPVVVGDVALWNGPIPQVAGPHDDLHDLAPLLFPSEAPIFTLGSSTALGTFLVAYCYRFQDASGRVYRSARSPIASAAFLSAGTRTIAGQSLFHVGRGTVIIEIYGSVAGGTDLYLQATLEANTDPTSADLKTATVFPERWTADGELLDPAALSQAPPPASRCAAFWRGRLFLSGTPVPEEIWFSQEMQAGRGPEFNEVLIAEWLEGVGAPRLLAPCDRNFLSLHKADGTLGALSGIGPDGLGVGAFNIDTLNGRKAARVGSAVTGPAGLYYQNLADGRICLLPPGGAAVDIGRGVESHRSTNVVAALHVEPERAVWFFLSDGKVLVLNYGFATPTSPLGRWSVSSGPSFAAVGAAMNGTTPRFLEANTVVGFRSPGATFVDSNSGSSADVLTKISLSKLRPIGHQVEFMVDRCYFEGQHIGASTLRITVTNDLGQTETFTKAGTTSPLDYMVTPGGQTLRTKEFGVTIEETASGTEGFVYDTFAADIKTLGKLKVPNAGNWIAPG